MINISKMEFKCTNLNGEIVLRSKLNYIKPFLRKIVKIALRNESYMLFLQEDALIVQKTKIVHNFLITNYGKKNNSHNKNIIYEKRVFFKSKFEFLFVAPCFELI